MVKGLTYGKNYSAVEHTSNEKGACFNLLTLEKIKEELVIKEKKQVANFNELFDEKEKPKHVFLILNNTNVLSKETDVVNENSILVVQNVFPNIRHSDFYYEVLKTDTKSFVSIIRKNEVDTIINTYKNNGIAVVGFSLGNLAIQNLIPFIDNFETINTSNSKIQLENNQINIITKQSVEASSYTINSLTLTNNDLIPLGGILKYYTGTKNTNSGLSQINSSLKEEFLQKRYFKLGLYAALGFLFVTLLINLIAFSNISSTIDQLNFEIQSKQAKKNQLLVLQNNLLKKEELIASLQSSFSSKASLYFDEIAEELPTTILLSKLNYQPLSKRIKKEKSIQVEKNIIQVEGIVKEEIDFNFFIEKLEKKDWVKNVIIANYGKGKTTINTFEIEITIENEQ